jgi:hypothetical protein
MIVELTDFWEATMCKYIGGYLIAVQTGSSATYKFEVAEFDWKSALEEFSREDCQVLVKPWIAALKSVQHFEKLARADRLSGRWQSPNYVRQARARN